MEYLIGLVAAAVLAYVAYEAIDQWVTFHSIDSKGDDQ